MSVVAPELLKTKQHFQVLDGLRGIAALGIVIFHFTEMVISDYSKNFIAHGFLAVDFFFCLSGFVIAYAYDDRLLTMGRLEFFKSRLIRLHPLIVMGSVLGLLSFLIDPYATYQALYNAGEIAMIFLTSIFLIPYPVMEERSFNLFSFNAPTWSLFWEYVANIVYAFVLYRIHRRPLVLLTILAGALACFVAFRAGNLMGGWACSNFLDGGVRVLYSFLAGMLVYRGKLVIKNNMGFLSMAVLLSLAFLVPYSGWNWIVEPLIVLLYFPLIVACGAGTDPARPLIRFCEFSGNISYPLYMTHYAVIWVFLNYSLLYKPSLAQLTPIMIIGTIVLVAFAYVVMVAYDIPVRRYLTRLRKTTL